jgi:hypothetical protein
LAYDSPYFEEHKEAQAKYHTYVNPTAGSVKNGLYVTATCLNPAIVATKIIEKS